MVKAKDNAEHGKKIEVDWEDNIMPCSARFKQIEKIEVLGENLKLKSNKTKRKIYK